MLLPVRPVRLAACVVLAGSVLLGSAAAAAAHDALVGSDPADGAALDAAPAQVVLTFSADHLEAGSAVTVTGQDGSQWADGPAVVAGPTVTQPLLPGLPGGSYVVLWRSVAADGHPIEGTLGFTVRAPETPAATPSPAGTPPSSAPSPAAPSAPSTAAGGTATARGGAAPVEEGAPTSVPWPFVIPGGVLLVMATVLVGRRLRGGS